MLTKTNSQTKKKKDLVVAKTGKRPVGRPKSRVIIPVRNISDLRENLMQLYNDVQVGNIDHSTAKTIGNISGKIISCINTEMKLRRFNNEKKVIDIE